jgi:hypothetical protein
LPNQALRSKNGQIQYMWEEKSMRKQPNWQIVIERNNRGFVVDVAVFDRSTRKQTEKILDALEPILARG